MPTSATGTERPRSGTGGFTLIEVLVVVAIAGILVAVAAVNLFPDERERGRRAAGEVALQLEGVRDLAWFGGLPTAVSFEDRRLRVWRYAGDAWRPQADRERELPPEVAIAAVRVDGQPQAPRERIVFLADGLATPLAVVLDIRGARWTIDADVAGAVRVAGP